MSGTRQHIIPRFLMKGFASRVDGEEVFTWAYRKNSTVFEGNTKNINIENNFYGKEGEDVYADDILTDLEANKFSPLINKLRKVEGNVDFLRNEITDFISHLIIRTKNFRSSFYDFSENITQRLDQYVSNPKNLEKIILNQPIFIKKQFEKVWQESVEPLLKENTELLKSQGITTSKIASEKEKFYAKFLKELPKQAKTDLPEYTQELIKGFSQIKSDLPEIIKKAHINRLKGKPVIENKIEDYSGLSWFVISVKTSLILSDAGCLFEVVGKRRFRLFDDSKENLINVFLPLSSQKLLVGSKYRILPNFGINLLNKVAACCSYDLFISSENSTDRLKLSNLIGSWATLLTDGEIEFYINRIFGEIESTDSLVESENQ